MPSKHLYRTINPASINRVAAKSLMLGTVLVLNIICLQAQTYPETIAPRGLIPTGSFESSNIDAINAVNGNVLVQIPITTLPVGRAGFTLGVKLIHNSQIYDISPNWQPSVTSPSHPPGQNVLWSNLQSSGVAWSYGYYYTLKVETRARDMSSPVNCNSQDPTVWKIYRTTIISPDGSHHTLHLYPDTPSNPSGYGYWDTYGDGYYDVDPAGNISGCSQTKPPVAGDLTYYTSDGSYLKLVVHPASGTSWLNRPWTLYFLDGGTATGTGRTMASISDKNGNTINIVNTLVHNLPAERITDWLTRSITIVHGSNGTQDSILQDGPPEGGGQTPTPLAWYVNWRPVYAAASLKYRATVQNDYLSGSTITNNTWGVTSVVLPTPSDGSAQTYTINYSDANSTPAGWGELNDIQLPSGARVHYTYSLDGKDRNNYITENPVSQKDVVWMDEADNSQRTDTWKYSFLGTSSEITIPGGKLVDNYFNDPHIPSSPDAGLIFKTTQPDGSTVEKTWQHNRPYGSQGGDPANPYVKYEFRSVVSGSSPVQASVKTFTYDKNGNLTVTTDYGRTIASSYGWIPYASITPGAGGAPTAFSGGSTLRTTTNAYYSFTTNAGDGSEMIADVANGYWHPGSPNVRNLLTSASTTGVGPGSSATYSYWDSSGHPNLIQENHYNSQTSSNETTIYGYDGFGNRTSVKNARLYTTTFSYDGNNCMYQKLQASGTASQRKFTYLCDFSSGLPTSETDFDHSITHAFQYDRFGRQTLLTETGTGLTRHRATDYFDGTRRIVVRSDLNNSTEVTSGGGLAQTTWVDQLGRTRLTSDPSGASVQTRYWTPSTGNPAGNSYRVSSNPYISGSEPTMGWTRATVDPNGRTTEIQNFSGSTLPSPWGTNTASIGKATTSYSSNVATVTDVAGVARANYTDGLGRLMEVTENGISANTLYTYDSLDNLTGVTPPTGLARTFTYSSLSRLVTAFNPESGTSSYTYDPNGNVATRVLGTITTTFGYNELDQITSKTYNDTPQTPQVTYGYNKGWLTSVTNSNSVYQNTTFDGFGRVTDSSQTTGGVAYPFHYTYNLIDGFTSTKLPSQRIVSTTYDGAGRATTLSSVVAGQSPTTYVSAISYAPQEAMQQITLGNTLTEQTCFNARLQPLVIRQRTGAAASCVTGRPRDASDVLHLSYAYESNSQSANTGNVSAQTITYGSKVFSQSYTYDAVSRLITAGETVTGTSGTPWSQTYRYDLVGNRWISINSGIALNPFTPTTNVYDNANHMNGSGAQYVSGNQTQIGGYVNKYDAENRLVSSTINSATTNYSYDGNGRRVKKATPTATTTYVYDTSGELAAEYWSAPFPAPPCATCYLMADHLGSTRMMSDTSGHALELHDYLPFGEELVSGTDGRDTTWGGPDPRQKFTGKERDSDSGLDWFESRYLSSAQGRFTSPDIPLADQQPEDPQSWNMYGYARNNPLRNVDPTGQACVVGPDGKQTDDHSGGQSCAEAAAADKKKAADATVIATPVPPTWAQVFNFDPAYDRARAQQVELYLRENNIQTVRGEIPIGPPGLGAAAAAAEDANLLAKLINILRRAVLGKGNFGLGSGTAEDAATLGKAWVGEGAKVASDGKTLISADGLRQYRPPSFKPNLGKTQANFEGRPQPSGQWQANGHLDVK